MQSFVWTNCSDCDVYTNIWGAEGPGGVVGTLTSCSVSSYMNKARCPRRYSLDPCAAWTRTGSGCLSHLVRRLASTARDNWPAAVGAESRAPNEMARIEPRSRECQNLAENLTQSIILWFQALYVGRGTDGKKAMCPRWVLAWAVCGSEQKWHQWLLTHFIYIYI